MRKWVFLGMVAALLAMNPALGGEGRIPQQLLEAAEASRIDAHAFFLRATVVLPPDEAQAALRLGRWAAQEWPSGEARLSEGVHECTLVLAAACPPDAAQATAMVRRMRSILGREAQIAYCLTGRTTQPDLTGVAMQALLALDDVPIERLQQREVVSLTGAGAQVALRRDTQGAQAYLAQPLVPMDY